MKSTPTFWQLPTLAAGTLEVRLAENATEIEHAQSLRYKVFVEDMGAKASNEMHAAKRDWDEFDAVCDHLLVVDHSLQGNNVVGTYRLLRGAEGKAYGKFYTAGEYDISKMMNVKGEILELGRSCVHPNYRSRSSMQLLWRGIGAYVTHYDIKYMFGCASFPGTDLEALKLQLSYLYHNHLMPDEYRIRALPERYVNMNLVPKEECSSPRVVASLPPLIKGYLRLGGYIGDGAVLDPAYNTTDVCVLVKTDNVTDKYYNRYSLEKEGGNAE
ncbi:MAG: GNAT family N-acetyltransferase [Proteobacteria bacterium]|nr:GNAT family N-acetyltransferase [Pseudomonadota bacterium]